MTVAMTRLYLGILVSMTILAVACRGPSKTATPATSTARLQSEPTQPGASFDSETGLAQSMLLTLADFPAGTVEKPRSPPTPNDPLLACQPAHPAGSTGFADTAEFSRGTSVSDIEERIHVFRSSSDALAWLTQYKTEVDCIVGALNAGSLNSGSATIRDAVADPISFPAPPNAQSTAYRTKVTGSSAGREVVVTIDIAVVVVGRVAYSLDGGPSGYSADEIAPYLARAASKIQQQLH